MIKEGLNGKLICELLLTNISDPFLVARGELSNQLSSIDLDVTDDFT